MKFLPYEDVPLYLANEGGVGEFIYAESAELSVNSNLSAERQLDDNVFQIFSYSDSDSVFSHTFEANVNQQVTLGSYYGPPKPIATSISKIPKDTKITFPNGKHLYFSNDIEPDGHNYTLYVYAKSGGWSLDEFECQSGYFDPIYKHVSSSPVAGQLNVNFYLNTGNLPAFFNITGLANPSQFPPVNEERITGFIGDFVFDHAYLNSLSFSVSPNSISQASASFSLYGSIRKVEGLTDDYFNCDIYKQQSIAHGDNTSVVGADSLGIEHPIGFSYNINVERVPSFEAPNVNSSSDVGLVPRRVSKRSSTIQMSVEGEHIDPDILSDGFNGRQANLTAFLRDLSYSSFEDNSNGLIHAFNCSGVITSQSLRVGSEGHLNGSVSVVQKLR
jgi:hypothetical protein